MLFVIVDVELFDHPKTLEVAEVLDTEPTCVVGQLAALWSYTQRYAPDGVLGDRPRLIAHAARWSGDPAVFVAALENAGFLDRLEDGRLAIHDWGEYGGRLGVSRAKHAARERDRRAAQRAEDARSVPARDTHVARTGPARDAPKIKIQNKINKGEPPLTPPPEPVQTGLPIVVALAPAAPVSAPPAVVLGHAAPEPTTRPRPAYSAEFEQWWQLYPRKGSKESTWNAWRGLTRKEGVTTTELLAALQRYRGVLERDRVVRDKTIASHNFLGRAARWREYVPGGDGLAAGDALAVDAFPGLPSRYHGIAEGVALLKAAGYDR
jgi:hypothetical protein